MSVPLSPKNANNNGNTVPSTGEKHTPTITAKALVKKDAPPASVKSPQLHSKKETYSPLQKTPQPHPKSPPVGLASPTQPLSPSQTQKKVSRRSSKPIINWFQRKLAGTGRTRRASEGHGGRPAIPHFDAADIPPVPRRERTGNGATGERPKSTPGPIETGSMKAKAEDAPPVPSLAPNTISLNGDDDEPGAHSSQDDRESLRRSSFGPESMWSPSVAVEADEDASLRPIPPSAPPSPSLSHSSSSYLSDPRTFRSMAASTKPTTVLSVDLGNGMAHIAEAPPSPRHQVTRFPQHIRTSSLGTGGGLGSGGSISFALPQTPASLNPPSTSANPAVGSPYDGPLQAPLHTTHHPRDNPRPSSPPEDDASVLTLASSAYGFPGARMGADAPNWNAGGASMMDVGDSVSQFQGPADSTSQFAMDEDGDREQNVSMRALRSRRSWESEASRWSARIGGTSLGPSTPAGERSLWAGTSLRTGTRYSFGEDKDDRKYDAEANGDVNSKKSADGGSILRPSPGALNGDVASTKAANGRLDSPFVEEKDSKNERDSDEGSHHGTASDVQATPQVSPRKHLPGDSTPIADEPASVGYFHNLDKVIRRVQDHGEDQNDDTRSFMTGTDGQTDVWVSAPSTPLGFHIST